MRDWAKWSGICGFVAAIWCGADWAFGNITSLREFAVWQLVFAVVFVVFAAIGDWFRARAAQREYREVKEMERQVRARYFERTGQQWPD